MLLRKIYQKKNIQGKCFKRGANFHDDKTKIRLLFKPLYNGQQKAEPKDFFYPLLNEMTPDTVLILNRRVNNQQRRLRTVAQIQQLLVKRIALVKGVYLIVQMA